MNHAKRAQSAIIENNGNSRLPGARCATNPTFQPRPRLATIDQAAVYLALGTPEAPAVRSVWRLIEAGTLTPVRLPGLRRTFVEWTDLDALITGARDEAPNV